MENTLEIFYDFGSPFCYLMMPEIERLRKEFKIQLKWRSYLIKPDAAAEGESFNPKELNEANDPVFEKIAKEQNFPWTNSRIKRFRTQPAHIIAKWADENSMGDVYRQTVFYYYFVLQKNIALPEVLKEIIIKTGFYEIKPGDILNDKKYVEMFEEDLKMGNELGINETPVIVNNGKMIKGFVKFEELERFITKNV